MTYRYKCGNEEGCCDNAIRTNYGIVFADEFKNYEDGIFRPVILEKTDQFGTYRIELMHQINGQEMVLINACFEPAKEETEETKDKE